MMNYESPKADIRVLSTQDIITTSGAGAGDGGDDGTLLPDIDF